MLTIQLSNDTILKGEVERAFCEKGRLPIGNVRYLRYPKRLTIPTLLSMISKDQVLFTDVRVLSDGELMQMLQTRIDRRELASVRTLPVEDKGYAMTRLLSDFGAKIWWQCWNQTSSRRQWVLSKEGIEWLTCGSR